MLTQLFAIIRNTFVESVRQPIMVVLILAGSLLLVLSTAGAANTMDDDNLIFIQIGLSTLLICGLIMAAFTATGVLSLEIENKTALTVISKPVTRPLFIIGKYLGVCAALSVAMWPLLMALLLCVRHGVMQTASHEADGPVLVFGIVGFLIAIIGSMLVNYLYRWPFVSTFVFSLAATMTAAVLLVLVVDSHWDLQPITSEFTIDRPKFPSVLLGAALLYEALLIYSAVAIVVSTRLNQVMTIIVSFGYGYLMPIISSLSAKLAASITGNGPVDLIGKALATLVYHTTPDVSFLWVADDLSTGLSLSADYVITVTIYSSLFIVALLGIAIALFQEREVG